MTQQQFMLHTRSNVPTQSKHDSIAFGGGDAISTLALASSLAETMRRANGPGSLR